MAIVALKMQKPKKIFRAESFELCRSQFLCPFCGADQITAEFFTETGGVPIGEKEYCTDNDS